MSLAGAEALAKPRGPGHAAQPERLGEERMPAIRVDGLEFALGLTQLPQVALDHIAGG